MSTLAQGHANLLCVVPKTLAETRQSSKKETTKIQRCSEPRVQQMSTAVDQTATIPRTRVSSRDPGEQHTVTRKTCVLVKNCHPRVTFDAPKPDTRNRRSTKTKGKHGQREIIESRDIRQVPTKRRVEVQSQNRDLLIRDVCTCLACPKTFPRSLTTLKRHVDVIRTSYA